jgi:membrane protein implicated in regulation of membrane protease activity
MEWESSSRFEVDNLQVVETVAEKEIQMSWEFFYEVCFGVGLVLSILSFAGGLGHVHFGHVHVGHLHLGRGHSGRGTRAGATSPFNMFTAMSFLCWFGGTGYLLSYYRFAIAPVVFFVAVITGLAGAALIFAFLVKVLLPHEHILLPEDTEMRGVVGRVSSALRPSGTGEILFSLDGTRRSAPARAENGVLISKDAQVLVVRYEHGVAWVRPFTDLEELEEPQKPG